MTAEKILVVDDDLAILNLLDRFLSQKKYQVESAGDGKTALALFEKQQPKLVVLDLNLPDTTGFQLCQKMKACTNVLVLVLTSMTGDSLIEELFLQRHVDDYMAKPFSLVELAARVEALLRRYKPFPHISQKLETLKFGSLAIDPRGREVKVKGNLVDLTALEFDLLYGLASKPNCTWKRSEIIGKVWGDNYIGDQRVVDVHIGQIRKKLEFNMIKTVRGIGYKFEVS